MEINFLNSTSVRSPASRRLNDKKPRERRQECVATSEHRSPIGTISKRKQSPLCLYSPFEPVQMPKSSFLTRDGARGADKTLVRLNKGNNKQTKAASLYVYPLNIPVGARHSDVHAHPRLLLSLLGSPLCLTTERVIRYEPSEPTRCRASVACNDTGGAWSRDRFGDGLAGWLVGYAADFPEV